jgi:predicted transcriptional regulator
MPNTVKHSESYLKFIHLSQALRALPGLPELDPIEERLLNSLASAWFSEKEATVLETMRTTPDMSPSTVHRRLKTLRKKGLINFDIDVVDNRIKYIVKTDITDQYFAHLGKCMNSAFA